MKFQAVVFHLIMSGFKRHLKSIPIVFVYQPISEPHLRKRTEIEGLSTHVHKTLVYMNEIGHVTMQDVNKASDLFVNIDGFVCKHWTFNILSENQLKIPFKFYFIMQFGCYGQECKNDFPFSANYI
ncbi:hypothetical protein GJAV_G00194260 [Gymnothorax javanicus]|nr:hypothetical protein GJAV_G00194260 [Gymnothorax javanicus]